MAATGELLEHMQRINSFATRDVAAVFFSVTGDIHSAFPARAARGMGWDQVPLMCFREMEVEGSLSLCIRILVLWNTELDQEQIRHVYLHGAQVLRPDLQWE